MLQINMGSAAVNYQNNSCKRHFCNTGLGMNSGKKNLSAIFAVLKYCVLHAIFWEFLCFVFWGFWCFVQLLISAAFISGWWFQFPSSKAPSEFFIIYFYLLFENHTDIKKFRNKESPRHINHWLRIHWSFQYLFWRERNISGQVFHWNF